MEAEIINENMPLISIIVPVYNIKEYLPRCVESLRAQSYSNIEILLIDDGSDDGTGKLCDLLGMKDKRIRVYHKENGGSSQARNFGIARAGGEYFGFVDSDDYVEYNMYELLYRAIEENGVMAAQIGRDELDEEGNRLSDICVPPDKAKLIGAEEFLRELLLHKGDCSFCTKLIKREVFLGKDALDGNGLKAEFPTGVLNEDFHLLVKLLKQLGEIVSLPERGYHVFCRMGSNTRKKQGFSRVFEDNVTNADMVSEVVKREYPALKKIAFRFGIFQRLDYLLHIPVPQMNRNNEAYRRIVRYLRRNWFRGMCNPYLTGKNKLYHTLFAIAPRSVRVLHGRVRGITDNEEVK